MWSCFLFRQWGLPKPGVPEPLLVWPDHKGWHWGPGARLSRPESPAPEGLHTGTEGLVEVCFSNMKCGHFSRELLLHFSWCSTIPSPGSIPPLFSLSTQLEDEALKHIQNYCHELVSLNFQSCSVSSVLFLQPPSCPTFLESPVAPLWSPQAGGMVAAPSRILCPHTICRLATRWKNNSLNRVADTKPFTFPTKNNIDWHLGLF